MSSLLLSLLAEAPRFNYQSKCNYTTFSVSVYNFFSIAKPQNFERKHVMGRSRQAIIFPPRATRIDTFREKEQLQTKELFLFGEQIFAVES